jgi:two-component system OmpR family response regulator
MRILIVEDEPTLRAQLAEGIGAAGYAVDVAENGTDAHYMGDTEPYDAVILDLGLPQMDGITVLRKWRTAGRSMPVLILTARDGWHEKVAGIDAGADDYLTKPFHMEELLARLRALIRRAGGHASSDIVCGPLTLDTRNSRATVAGQALTLTSHEYRVLAYLMHHTDEVVSRSDLVEHIYAQDFDRDSNTVEVFIARLRKKLPPGLIETVRGLGYRLTAQQ